MPFWGMAHAMGPNPNSRYARMPDDPKGEGLKAINNALARIDRATPLEAKLIHALHVLYDQQSIPDHDDRDQAYLTAMRGLNQGYPDDPDITALYAASYMSIRRWDYWDNEGNPKAETIPVAETLEHIIAQGLSHPGVFHLHIHLIEASLEPERALVSADALEATVPIAGHVVHMPSHIYIRVGQYAKAVENNVRSQAVDRQFAKQWGDHPLPNIGTYPPVTPHPCWSCPRLHPLCGHGAGQLQNRHRNRLANGQPHNGRSHHGSGRRKACVLPVASAEDLRQMG